MSDGSSRSGQSRSSRASQLAQAYRTANEILSSALSVGLLIAAGYWLDSKLDWTPILTICGACLGFVAAGASLRGLLRRLDQEAAQKKSRKPGNGERQSK